MPTLSRHVPRGDFLIHRGADERLGVRWQRDYGGGYKAVDMSAWIADLLLSKDGEALLSVPCTCTYDGLCVASLTGSQTRSLQVRTGEWRIDAHGPGGESELMGWGYFEAV
ncbi:hypothetical protein VJ923_06265 [Adlercreutzia sp. R25]|uniref:Uncharacterized protein n=1 Tax=Adlercreutzia shanghongiae TaxID=3111773 RepID=A0ABU6IWY3_9ACTN|nr:MULTISPECIES: hypothetical protein [unclassified Adlercreutzia]MEC4272757.1 hypothetical protein [Adlercreutzia sp. R25]MEC4294345.1 hypothetical protein [Adlercreutzia sp. R22]